MKKYLVISCVLTALIFTVGVSAGDVTIEQTVTITWPSTVGKFYNVLCTPTLNSPKWSLAESNVIGDGSLIKKSYTLQNGGFFRTEEVAKPDLTGKVLHRLDFPVNSNLALMKLVDTDIMICSFQTNNFSQSDLTGTVVLGADFSGSTMPDCKFNDCWMSQALFTGAKLQRAKFEFGHLDQVDFKNADLSNASFAGTTLIFCDFTGAFGVDLSTAACTMCLMPDGSLFSN